MWGLIVAMGKKPNTVSKLSVPAPISSTDNVRGNSNAPVTLIEYEDFQCPACATYFLITEKLFNESSSTLRMVFRHFPLSQHPNAIGAGMVSEAAANQGKFWQMYSLLYANQNDWAEKSNSDAEKIFDEYASTIGLDITKYMTDKVSTSTLDKITAEQKEGMDIGIDHTPTFFINGKEVNPTSYDEFKKLVNEAASSTTK